MIYLDSAATTRIDPEVLSAMLPYLTEQYGNPGSSYKLGRDSRDAVDTARKQVAELLICKPENIIFTSGGSEGNSMVFHGLKNHLKEIGKTEVLVSSTEHASVLNAAKWLEGEGFEISYLPVNDCGACSREFVEQKYSPKTGLVSIMAINNETGVQNDVFSIGEFCEKNDILYHMDCVQASSLLQCDLPCDFLTISSHKIHGPKGCGALYMKDIKYRELLEPMIFGSKSQEYGLRGGTENVANIVGFGKACELDLYRNHCQPTTYKTIFKNNLMYLLNQLGLLEFVHLNGDSEGSILNLRFDKVDSETLLLLLDSNGVAASAGSACHSRESNPSHVLRAMGLSAEQARNSVRFSFSKDNTKQEAEDAAEIVAKSVKQLLEIINK